MTARIAVDAMGGDHAPAAPVEGAVLAARELRLSVVLVGQEPRLRDELARHDLSGLDIRIEHAAQVVEMSDLPALAVRQKRESSLRVGLRLVKEGKADGFVSAGPTGAVWITAKVVLGPVEGVDRPALAAVVPSRSRSGVTALLDVGATVHCKARQLVQFAVMGRLFARSLLKVDDPRVGLLSVGEEDSKGTDTVREVLGLLRGSGLNLIGNVEGNDIYSGRADVVVCDGFTGNVALKASEGALEAITATLREHVAAGLSSRLGFLLLRPALRRFRKRFDYAEIGGAPLLGMRGCVIVCHGRSSAKAVKNALRLARDVLEARLDERIRSELHAVSASETRLVG